MSISVSKDNALPLNLSLYDGATDKYPLAYVYRDDYTQVPGSPFSLIHVSNGFYKHDSYTIVTADGTRLFAIYKVFDNVAHTIPSICYTQSEDIFDVLNGPESLVGLIADAVWEEPAADHPTAGTFGYLYQMIFSMYDTGVCMSLACQEELVDLIWNEDVTDHLNMDSTGWALYEATVSTVAAIAAAVWNESRAGHVIGGTFGQSLQGVLTPTRANNLDNLDAAISTRASAAQATAIQSDTDDIQAKIGNPANGSLALDLVDIDAETDAIKLQTDQLVFNGGRVVARAEVVTDKSGYSLTGAGEDAIADKVWDEARSGHTTPGSFGEANQGVVSVSRANNLDNLNATITSRESESNAAARFASVDADIATVDAKVGTIQNNTTFVGVVPPVLVLPASGSKVYKLYANLFNTSGNPENPDATNLTYKIMDAAGGIIVATTPMTNLGVGQFETSYTVLSTDPERHLVVQFDYMELGVPFRHYRSTEVQEFESKLDTLLVRLSAPRAANLDNLDATITSRASAAAVSSVQSDTDDLQLKIGIPSGPSIASDLSQVKGDVTAVKAKTDQITIDTGRVVAKAEVVTDKTGYALSSVAEDAVVDKVWDETIGGHLVLGTTGRKLNDLADITPLAIADAIWDEPKAGHTTPGTYGESNQGIVSITRADNLDNLDVQVSSRESEVNASLRYSDLVSRHTTTHTKLDSIANSHEFSAWIPSQVEVPASGTKTYKVVVNLNNRKNQPINADAALNIKIDTAAGAPILPIVGMTNTAPGVYEYDWLVSSSLVESTLLVTFTYTVLAQAFTKKGVTESEKLLTNVTDLTSRLTPTRAANLDFLDVPVSSRESDALAASRTASVIGAVGVVNTKLGAPVTTIAGDVASIKGDTATLIVRLSAIRAANLDFLDAPISGLETEIDALARFGALNAGVISVKGDTVKIGPSTYGTITADIANLRTALLAALTLIDGNTSGVGADVDELLVRLGNPSPASITSLLLALGVDVNQIPTNPVLATDPRLAYLDVAVSTRATPFDLMAMTQSLNLVELAGIIDDQDIQLEGVIEELELDGVIDDDSIEIIGMIEEDSEIFGVIDTDDVELVGILEAA